MDQDPSTLRGLEEQFLQKLKTYASQKGLTYSDLADKCGAKWRRSFAELKKLRDNKVRAREIKDLVYDLWLRGALFVEPPRGLGKAPRVWDLAAAQVRFSQTFAAPAPEITAVTDSDREALKAAYDRFVPDHLGGYVPVFKVRRALGWAPAKFDGVLQDLYDRREPVCELHAGDPQNYSEDEKADSVTRKGKLYLRMLWRLE